MKTPTVFSLFALCLSATLASATMTENHGIHAVPVPSKITIDGKLDDWDLSGQVLMCYDVEALKDTYSAKVAAMYDADNLYLSVHWTDLTPMGNSHDPHYRAVKAWAGDCVQFRIKTDKLSHVQSWYYAPKNEPSLFIDYGKNLTTPFGGGHMQYFQTEGWKLSGAAETAFRKDDDGKGYVQEIKLPWKLITESKQYKAGDMFNLGVELLWGEADWPVHRFADNLAEGATGREFFFTNYPAWGPLYLEAKGNLKLPVPAWQKAMQVQEAQGPVEIGYNLLEDARVTLAINDPSGKRIRNLVPALPRSKGTNTEHWDGLDDNGKPVPPGDYTFKALYHHGLHTTYTASFANPGNPTWPTSDNRGGFYGDHSAPQAAAAAGNFVALACPIGEGGKHLIGCNLDGQRLWGLPDHNVVIAGRISLATDGKLLWVGVDRAGSVYRVDIATGNFAPWNKLTKDAEGKDMKILDLPIFDPATLPTKDYSPLDSPNLRAVAVNATTLAVALNKDGVVKLIDKESGEGKGEIKIEEPRSLAFDQDGTLIVLAKDGQLVRATLDGKITPFAGETFPEGYGVAIDSKRNVYLSVRGAEQNVKIFSPEGKLTGEIGKRGGRPLSGAYIETGMRKPAGIAVDSQDRLWVTEETGSPKRTSLWATADGKLIKDFAGTTSYAGAGAINPFDPTMGFSDNTVYKIDLEKNTYKPTWSMGGRSGPDDLFPPKVHELTSRVIQLKGVTYAYPARGGCTQYKDGKWRSVAALGVVSKKDYFFQEHWSPLFEGHEGETYAWADLNGDGLVQADELKFASLGTDAKGKPITLRSGYWGQLPDDEGTLTFVSSTPEGSLIKYHIGSFGPGGEPIYDIEHPQIQTSEIPIQPNMIQGGKDGRVYVNQSPLTGFDKNGKVLFTYPSRYVSVHGSHNAPSSKPGLLIGPSSFLGVADMGGDIGEVFYLNGNLGENFVFTWDGLFIQALFKDTRGQFEFPEKAVQGMPWDMTTAGGESFGGNFIRTPDGKVYLTNGGTDARVIEITGLDKIQRFSGKFTYSPAQYVQAQSFNESMAVAKAAPKSFTIPKAAAPVVIDGKIDKWPELKDTNAKLIDIQDDPRNVFGRIAARYDNENLYLAYLVIRKSKFRNAGQDSRLLFKTGDVVDLMFGPGGTPNKTGVGNLRLLFSQTANQPITVLYEKTVPGTPAKDQVPFSSPWRTITFDRVTTPSDVKVAIAPALGAGVLVEVAIPWARLGVKPASGLKLRGDFGILSADNGGTITIARHYWSNKSTGLVNDIPGEAELTPKLWGDLTLE